MDTSTKLLIFLFIIVILYYILANNKVSNNNSRIISSICSSSSTPERSYCNSTQLSSGKIMSYNPIDTRDQFIQNFYHCSKALDYVYTSIPYDSLMLDGFKTNNPTLSESNIKPYFNLNDYVKFYKTDIYNGITYKRLLGYCGMYNGNMIILIRGTVDKTSLLTDYPDWKTNKDWNIASVKPTKDSYGNRNYMTNLFTFTESQITNMSEVNDGTCVGFHKGYLKQAIKVKNQILNYINSKTPNKVIITGHSMGGAISTILSMWLAEKYPGKVELYGFSVPRTGKQLFEYELSVLLKNQVYGFAIKSDTVPDLPTGNQYFGRYRLIDNNNTLNGTNIYRHLRTSNGSDKHSLFRYNSTLDFPSWVNYFQTTPLIEL